ncbi:hypothetical protein PLESTB_000507700 [Pleodorina starrii]|uniref:Serine/threonine-protein kinase RIO2 n=1 Tax=Pleodorina starrii TaxID=330485 RepID=A0A9W6BHB0_9CHLO|nr:hypothetical protein PLESTB_000507700 [Pleodorina starrii]GLC67696.1 hypothetical protein PLESTF_000595700 [Pleodorina starrii]
MKLDVNVLRYLSKDDFRVLTAVEMGQKNHELVPLELIDSISGLKHGGAFKSIKTLMRHKLLHHDGKHYDGYRLTYMGYDFLAIRALVSRGHISGVGRQIGVGKESDIFEVTNDDGEVFALKLHRLGRTSFRAVKSKRDYLGRRQNFSWLYLSRLAALKEFAFMKALYEHGFPVPQAIDNNRHAVLMGLVHARPMVQIRTMAHPARVYLSCMELISRLAAKGLIHCDFNEFNLLISEEEELTLIDFPQMVSITHANAEELFSRDVECIVRFFSKKIGYVPELDPSLPYVRPSYADAAAAAAAEAAAEGGGGGLDVALEASGFQRQHQKVLEEYLEAAVEAEGESSEGEEDDEEEEEEAEGEEGAAEEGTSGRWRGGEGRGGEVGEAEGDGEGLEEGEEGGSDVEEKLAQVARRSAAAAAETSTGSPGDGDGGGGGSGSEDEGEEGGSGSGSGDESSSDGDGEDGGRRRREGGRARGPGGGGGGGRRQRLGEQDVQAIVTAQRRKQSQRQAMTRASRNSSKGNGGKGGKKGGKKGAAADGW